MKKQKVIIAAMIIASVIVVSTILICYFNVFAEKDKVETFTNEGSGDPYRQVTTINKPSWMSGSQAINICYLYMDNGGTYYAGHGEGTGIILGANPESVLSFASIISGGVTIDEIYQMDRIGTVLEFTKVYQRE